jgi:DNA repair exonuclease SbcCD ATPase subunit
MIKNAKVGDVIFELKYDEREKTGDIIEWIVGRDQEKSDYIWINRNILVHPYEAFKTYKQAYNTYIKYLKQDLVRSNKTVALITDILSKIDVSSRSTSAHMLSAIDKPKSKKSQPPLYEADFCSVCGKKFDKEKEDQNSGLDVNVKWFGLDFCGECVSLPYSLLLVANKRLETYGDEYGTWTFDNFKEHPKLKLRIKQKKNRKNNP